MYLRIISASLFFIFSINTNAQQIEFQPLSYNQALSEASNNDKLVLLTFKAEWCKACKWMTSNVFNDPSIANTANQNFVPVKINYDRDEFWKHHYNVKSLPTTLILDGQGNQVAKIEGSSDPINFKSFLDCRCNIVTSFPATDPLLASIDDLPAAGRQYEEFITTKRENTKYSVQVASFLNYDEAETYLSSINNVSAELFIQKEMDAKKNPFYRVFAGRFQHIKDAVLLREDLTRKGYITKVIQYL